MTLLLETAEGVRQLGPEVPDAPLVGVIPGDDVALHRLTLLETAPARRLEEARMRAVDLSAQPIEDLHVAAGPAEADGASWVAMIDRDRMAAHLAHFRAAGVEPKRILPAALLLDEVAGGTLARLDDKVVIRTDDLAGLVEPDLAPHVAGSAWKGRFYLLPEFEPTTESPSAFDMLQGEFAPRLRWWKLRGFQIPAAILTILFLLLLIAPFLIERTRGAVAVQGYDLAVVDLAEATLGSRPDDAEAGAAALANARRAAEGGAVTARLSYAAAMIETAPGAYMESVMLQPDGGLRITLGGGAPVINALAPRIAQGPFVAAANGVTITLGDRRAGIAASPSALSTAMLRFVSARSDAAIITATRARPKAADPKTFAARVTAAFAAAGLTDARVTPTTAGTAISVPSARTSILLPLLADLELLGARYSALAIGRNADDTVSATLAVAP